MTNNYDKKNKKILLIDDEPDIIYSIKRVLEINEFLVDSYTDPTLALSNFKPGLYDLLLLDIKMPKMNGFDSYPRLDMAYFIQKPCRSEDLIRQVNEILDSH